MKENQNGKVDSVAIRELISQGIPNPSFTGGSV